MIVNEKVIVKTTNKNIKYYKKYCPSAKSGDEINIDIKYLSRGSKQKILVKCDECGIEKSMSYKDYIRITKHFEKLYYCKKCKDISIKKGTQEKYGVDNVFQLNSVKEKSKETNLEKYGVEHVSQNNNIKEKIKEKLKETKFNNTILYFLEKGIEILDKNKNIYTISCEKCGKYDISSSLLYNRIKYETILCTKCNPINSYNISGLELQLQEFIKDNYSGKIIENTRNIINPYEIDIYLPELKLAFELNGVYWHNELNKSNDYHYNKSVLCKKKNIQIIHIYEDDWKYKKEIVKSRILNKLNKTPNKIYARKCEIKEINDNKLVRDFLDKNHIQGFVGSSVKLGLYYNNELVSLMTFGKTRKPLGLNDTESKFELLRFCNKLNMNVIGGASKLFKCFINNYEYDEIISYADRSWSMGELYKTLDFNFVSETKPNYYYVIDDIRHNRYNFRKDILVKEGYNANKSEHEIMLDRKIYRIYDSGSLKYNFFNNINK